jgi:signal transduction histidine kinase
VNARGTESLAGFFPAASALKGEAEVLPMHRADEVEGLIMRFARLVGSALFEEGGHDGVAFVLDLSGQKQAEAEVLNERTRIARELHDTLLQSFHGVMFRFQGAANVLPDQPLEAKQRLETALEQGTQAIREGRDAIQGLRASTAVTNDLAVALGTLAEELASTSATRAQKQQRLMSPSMARRAP